MNKTVLVILILVAIVVILAVAASYTKPFFVESGKKILTVGNQNFEVGIADNALTRAQGLSGKSFLGEREGLLFLFSSAGNYKFWMKGMNFPIDIVWINADRVTGFSENIQPEPDKNILNFSVYYPPEEVDKVLEVNAGAVAKYNLKIGDAVSLK